MSKIVTKKELDFFGYADKILTCSLSQAIRENEITTLQRILNKRKTNPLPLSVDNRRWTALHVAASMPERKECLEMLLKYGDSVFIDLNAETHVGATSLHIACENGCEGNVLALLRNGCDPRKKKLDGSTPLHIAAMKGHSEIVDHLMDYRINIDDQDWQGYTPLHLAAMYGCFQVCCILLENGASVRLTDSDGNLPLHLACQNGYFEIVRSLLERDFSVINYQNLRGITPPMLAVQNHNVRCVRYLLDNGAKTEVCNEDMVIALQFAAAGRSEEVLKLVLQSTDMTSIEQYCLYNFLNILKDRGTFYSLICCVIKSGSLECLNVLLKSKLPKSILEAPFAENGGYGLYVFSPLAYLFSFYPMLDSKTLDAFLTVLLQNDVIYMHEFSKVLKFKWPKDQVKFTDPFSVIFKTGNLTSELVHDSSKRLHYFNILNNSGITPDYCLRCCINNGEYFKDFNIQSYRSFYVPLFNAIFSSDIETLKLFISNSVIIEPDQLCSNLVSTTYPQYSFTPDADFNKKIAVCEYLLRLKPFYYSFRRNAGKSFTDLLHKEFCVPKLKQLCRTEIRQQLRDRTVQNNLIYFRNKIDKLPLPQTLKDYLLFQY